MGIISRAVDRAVNRTALPGTLYARQAAMELVREAPVVDLLVGSALFRDSFVVGGAGGHVDLPRLRSVGVNVVGLTIATSWPDLRGTLSRWNFRSLGLPRAASGERMAIAEWIIGRIEQWCANSREQLAIIRSADDLERCLAPSGPVGVLLGAQGAHVLDGDLGNVARLRERGVRMLAPAHVMDNEAVGSGTGRRASGLSGFGRELTAELEAKHILIDLAHMSVAGVSDALPRLTRPFVLSHTGLCEAAGSRSRWRRYSAATRNIPASLASEVAASGGLVGITLSTQLLGGSRLSDAVRTITLALKSAGPDRVAIGSDMDGALRMVIDVEGLPALADALLADGLPKETVSGVLGANAIRFLRASLA